MQPEIYSRLAEILDEGKQAVLVVVVSAEGPVPREPGAKMIVYPDGAIEGTIGGGSLEKKAIEVAKAIFREGGAKLETYNLEDLGMICGGRAAIYYELVAPPVTLHIFGAGHVGRKLYALAAESLPFRIRIYDIRKEAKAALPEAELLSSYGDLPAIAPRDYVFICTHSHKEDYRTVKAVLSGENLPAYVGLVGSAPKWAEMKTRLISEGVPPERCELVSCPVGLPLGGKDPGAIAVSALAEILAHYHGRLRELRR